MCISIDTKNPGFVFEKMNAKMISNFTIIGSRMAPHLSSAKPLPEPIEYWPNCCHAEFISGNKNIFAALFIISHS